MIKESKLLKIKSKILSNLFSEKYGLKLGEFNNITGTERVKEVHALVYWYFYTTVNNVTIQILVL